MRLIPSDIFSLYRPTLCALRVYLREQRIPEAEAGVFEEILQTLGQRHEQSHLATLGGYEDLSAVSQDQRVQRTLEAVRNRVPVIYQGELTCDTILGSTNVSIVGRPDFLILDGDAYLIRDSKLSRKVDDKHHVEIALQLQLYGWLFEQTVGEPANQILSPRPSSSRSNNYGHKRFALDARFIGSRFHSPSSMLFIISDLGTSMSPGGEPGGQTGDPVDSAAPALERTL